MASNDAFDFSRFFGGNMGFGMPGIVTPTLDVDELDKKIKDLKAVEGWLSMNLSMLQMSIQGLEVQRNTLSSLKAMGEAFNQSMSDVSKAAKADPAPAAKNPFAASTEEGAPAAGVWPWDFATQAMAALQQQMQAKTENTQADANDEGSSASSGEESATQKAARARKPKTEKGDSA